MDYHDFLNKTDWQGIEPQWFSADWSMRRYGRLINEQGKKAILLQSPPDSHPDSMVGHKLGEWLTLNRHFKSLGLNTPEIYAEDAQIGYVLMEDFGNESLSGKGQEAYEIAVDVLVKLRDAPNALAVDVLKYEDTHVRAALRFYPEYVLKRQDITEEWFETWHQVELNLPSCPRVLTHIDYFSNNLMWLPDRAGTDRIGILDFQAACNGPFTYDIVNLLDDARRDLPEDLKRTCIKRYCQDLSAQDKEAFDVWYIVMAAQFHARVLGQIVKLGQERNRTDLMVFHAPLTKRFEKELRHPVLRPILDFIKTYSQ